VVSQPPASRSNVPELPSGALRAFSLTLQRLANAKGRTCVRPFNSPEVGLIAVVSVPLLQRVAVVIAV
jgi:hypothetical protein